MYALSPSLVELLTGKLSPCNWSLAEYFPNIQYAILNRLYTHSLKHDQFVITSGLFANKYGTDSPTRDYFRILVETITKIISHPSTIFDNWYIFNNSLYTGVNSFVKFSLQMTKII